MSIRRTLATFGAVFALAASGLVPATAAAADTVLAEDFEDSSFAPWTPSGGGAGTLSVVDYGGDQVLQVSARDQDYVGIQSPTGVFEPGETYTFSMNVRLADGVAGTPGVRFVMKPAYDWVGNTTMSAAGWTTVTGSYAVPAGADPAQLQVYVGTGDLGSPYTYLVDDIVIDGPPAGGPEIVTDIDFDDSTTGDWTQSGGGAGTLSFVDSDGGKALKVSGRDQDYVGIQSPTGVFEPGATYDVTMQVRLADGVAGTAGVRFVMKPAYDWIGNTTMSAAGWTTVTGSYAVPADANPTALQLYLGTGGEPGASYDYLVDDLLVTKQDGGDPGPDPDIVPGGAVNPTTTPVTAAQGSGNVAALTFDDGPNGEDTEELLDFLADNDLHAVFCVIGQNIQAPGGTELLQRIVADGHMLCNHSTNYDDMGALSQAQASERMVANLQIIRDALGDPDAKVPFFRAPNGSWGNTPAAAVALGMQPLAVINTINDWAEDDEAVLTANLRAAMKPGEVVLVHDGGGDRGPSVQAVKTVVSERLDAGWTFALPAGAPPAGGEVVLSTDFEDGLDGWGPRDNGTGAPTVAITSEFVHGGAQAAAVTGRTSQGSGIGHDVTGILDGGVGYEVSAWLRFAPGQSADDVWLTLARTADGSTTYQTLGQFDGMSNTEWVQVRQTFTMAAADEAYLYFETDYNGTNTSDLLIDDIVVRTPDPLVVQDLEPIKDTVAFPVGVAIDSRETSGAPSELLLRHFDQITSENFMKPEAWYDVEGEFTPNDEADLLMEFAQDNDLRVYGHTLVWHSQTPAWFFQDDAGQPLGTDAASQAVLRDRMREHIFAVAEHLATTYGDFGSDSNPVVAFDVVNEVVSDGSEFDDGLRRSEWYRILGEEFIDLAFEYADEAFNDTYAADGADRPVTLFINDYNTEQAGKQQRLHDLVARLLQRGVPVDGVGHQFHVSLAMPVSALEGAIVAFEDLGLTQAVTELDVTTGTPVTEALLIEQGYYYRDAFAAFREHADGLFSVTVWGLTDGRSWRASSGDPLVFDDALQAKPAYYGIVDHELPDRLRTATVFQGDVPLGDDAFAAIEWAQLPLHRIDDEAAFQLRWAGDHLTAYVTVDDATPDPADGIEFELSDGVHTFGRDGGGTLDGVVEQFAGGYAVVVHLPGEFALAGEVEFDVRVLDGGTERGWNSPGVLGTLTLVEPLSYVEVAAAGRAPEIDGVPDEVWAGAESVGTDKQVQGTGGATAVVRTLWRDGTLYVLAEVTDPVVDVSGSDPWIQDSVEVYVDAGNVKNGAYRYDDTQIRISAANVVSFGTGDEAFQQARVQSATALAEGGYVVELAVDLLEAGGPGTFHGLDFQVNDASGGARTGIRNWADPTGAGYQSTARWGVGRLMPAADGPSIALSASTVHPGGRVAFELSGFEEGDEVRIVLADDDQPAASSGRAVPMAIQLPTTLVTLTVGPDGSASGAAAIPADTPVGAYRLDAVVDGTALASAALQVVAVPPATVAFTGVALGAGIWAALGLLLTGLALMLARRRREGLA